MMTYSAKAALVATALVTMPGLAAAQDWDGLYGGLTLGYAAGDADHSFSNGAPDGNSEPDGALLGGFLGFGYQNGNTVWGGEIDLETSDFSGSFAETSGSTSAGQIDGEWQGSIRAVLGYASQLGGRPALFYGTVGYAVGEFDFRGGPAGSPLDDGYDERMEGPTAGVGLDWRFAPQAALRAEYRYTDFGEAKGDLEPGFPGVEMPVDVTQNAIRISVRFDF
ncbi:outer membrane protein [Cognatiyoonia sp. IB215182]|uniref:outer membrane protein n=1 Tax=Cognatiyoonia sp. IB215182 TaxID=3097353 RepID=UPI002A15D469|nr:outer membrane beta-barrel protein [Cognatiyoonia sp. IB215182]MDX8353861.1 outer membrane beta-barrel protein [Cognatiyoonia sp. IB215182]